MVIKFDIEKIKNEGKRKELPLIIENQGKYRFTGEFTCVIRYDTEELNREVSPLEVYDNKEESTRYGTIVYYVGDMNDGLPDGKGKLIWEDGEFLYEGEFDKGKITGVGKGYFANGKISEEGCWLNGQLHGEGKRYYENGQVQYQGSIKEGRPEGYGSEYYPNGRLRYEGMWEDGWNIGSLIKYSKNGISFISESEKVYFVDPKGNKIREISKKEIDELTNRVEVI